MVNEFQLGIYAYDAIQYHDGEKEVIDNGLGLNDKFESDADFLLDTDTTVKSYFQKRGFAEIPYSVFKELGDVADLEANYDTGLSVEDGKAAIYPRNLLWNRFFNNHSIFVITNGSQL